MKKIISIALILVLVASMSLAVIPLNVKAANTSTSDNYTAINDATVKAKGPVVETGPDMSDPDPVPYYSVGAVVRWVTADLYYGYYYTQYFKLMAIGTNAEIWVACDASGIPALNWPSGDPRPTPVILDNEISFLLTETDNLIYPTDVQYFGAPAVRDGTLAHYGPAERFTGSTRLVILVENIIDENYYDPTYPYYVAGYFDSGVGPYYADRNVITIDSYNWQYRLGPLGTIWTDNISVSRPYVYDSTIAHEFQHLIHADWNPGDDLFMNEGCAMYAEFLCGFGIDPSYINSYLYTPDNSLTIWGDQGDINILADYGVGALWLMYLNDHYGGAPTIKYFVQTGIAGIDGVNNALKHFGYKQTFDNVFHDWRLANLIHTDFPGCTKYNYKSLNLNDPIYESAFTHAVSGLPVPQKKGTDFGNTFTDLGYDTGVSEVGPYGSDYINFTNWKTAGFIYFDGNDYADVPGWTLTADGWWSGTGVNMQDTSIAGSAAVSTTNPTLTIVTKYSTEPNWDFAFVQVSTDGNTWTSLSNAYTTSSYLTDVAAIYQSMPGLTGPSPSYPSFITMSFNLTAYAGKTVQIRFRYMTDEATTIDGWWIQSATVNGTPMTLAAVPHKATFQVTVIQAIVLCGKTFYLPYDMCLTKNTNKGMGIGAAIKPSYVLLVVSPTMHMGFADYTFQATKLPIFKFC